MSENICWKTLIYQNICYENYEISNVGNVRNKRTKQILKNRIITFKSKNRKPYLSTSIGLGKRGKYKTIILHRAVAETFLNNTDNYRYIVFKDNDFTNVNSNNLYWSNHKYSANNTYTKKKKKNNSQAVSKRRRKLKEMSVEYKGGKCKNCGYDYYIGALEFHHINPEEKDFSISAAGTTKSWENIKKELDKCICLCSNCHKEVHAGLIDIKTLF